MQYTCNISAAFHLNAGASTKGAEMIFTINFHHIYGLTTTIYMAKIDSEIISAPLCLSPWNVISISMLIQSGDQNASVVLGTVPKSLGRGQGQLNHGATVNNRSFTFHFLRR